MKRLAVLTLMMLPGWVAAASGSYYFGGAVSQVDNQGVTAGLDDTSNESLEDSRSGKTIFFGHRFLSGSALELSYVDLGSEGTDKMAQSSKDRTMATEGTAVNYVTNMPVEQLFEVNMSVGVMRWIADHGYGAEGESLGGRDTGLDLTYGLGATRDLGQNCIGRVGWTRFQVAGEVVNVGSIGMAYSF